MRAVSLKNCIWQIRLVAQQPSAVPHVCGSGLHPLQRDPAVVGMEGRQRGMHTPHKYAVAT